MPNSRIEFFLFWIIFKGTSFIKLNQILNFGEKCFFLGFFFKGISLSLKTPIPFRNGLGNLSLNQNGISGAPAT